MGVLHISIEFILLAQPHPFENNKKDIIFDGKNIAEENIPRFLRWIPKVGLIRWGFEGLCVNEFEGLEFDTGGGGSSSSRRGPMARTGADALARFGLGTHSLGDVIRAQFLVTSAGWIISCFGLMLTGQKYLPMKTPVEVGLPSTVTGLNQNADSKNMGGMNASNRGWR
jgi:hypothetical protein